MLTDEDVAVIERLPKVELHVHLEGATDAETVWEMARRNRVDLPASSLEEWQQHYAFRDFNHFIDIYGLCASTMQTPADWQFMVERFLQRQAAQNVVYSEVFLSGSYVVDRLPADEWIDAISAGARQGEQLTGSRARFIIDISRHLPETQDSVLQYALAAAESNDFIGIGLGGIEDGFPARLFIDTFAEARRQGLHVVAHAGETTGPESVRDTIQLLQAERIGHGIRCLDDADLVEHLRKMQTPLEVCPTSNYCLGIVDRDQPHPLRRMVDAGLLCTVNSDDPPMFGTSLVDEFLLLARQGFTIDELHKLNRNAITVSFLTDEEKAAIHRRIQDSI